MLGAFAVGKTSLVRRFVTSMFSEKYHTTVGVKVDKKVVQDGGEDAALLIWDIQGEDETSRTPSGYLRGAAGALLVADGTRRDTLDTARRLRTRLEGECPGLPVVLILNKSDLTTEWDIDTAAVQDFVDEGVAVVRTSARTGAGVEDAFVALSQRVSGASFRKRVALPEEDKVQAIPHGTP